MGNEELCDTEELSFSNCKSQMLLLNMSHSPESSMIPECLGLAHTAIYKWTETWHSCFLSFSPPALRFYLTKQVLLLKPFFPSHGNPSFHLCLSQISRSWISLKPPKMASCPGRLRATGLAKAQVKSSFIHDSCLGCSGIQARLLPPPVPRQLCHFMLRSSCILI